MLVGVSTGDRIGVAATIGILLALVAIALVSAGEGLGALRAARSAAVAPALVAGAAFGLFFVLWGLLYLVGVRGLFAALLALVLSVPLSFVLLARPRERFTRNLEARVNTRRVERERLDTELDPDARRSDEL